MLPIPIVEHSAKVQIWLEADELCLSVAQIGESSLVLADSVSEIRFDVPLLAHLITFVDGDEVTFLVATRKRCGRVIYFEHCLQHNEHSRELDAIPF